MTDLQNKFTAEIIPKLQSDLAIKNNMEVPKILKIVLNTGLKDALKDAKIIDEAVKQLTTISGQKPVVTKAKKAIAGFKLRQGDAIGVMVTLRGKRMHDFLEKFIRIVLPRVRDFQGISTTAFDGHGNYSIGFGEMNIFPEVDSSGLLRSLGLQITINTTAKTDDHAKKLLLSFGMPFRKVKS